MIVCFIPGSLSLYNNNVKVHSKDSLIALMAHSSVCLGFSFYSIQCNLEGACVSTWQRKINRAEHLVKELSKIN